MTRRNILILSLAIGMVWTLLPATAAAERRVRTQIPAGSRVYLSPMDGFETWIVAGFEKKKVPLRIVSDI